MKERSKNVICECGHHQDFHMKGIGKCREDVKMFVECSCKKFKLLKDRK